ncbi:MAG: ABC transporter permease subunit [Acidimicrobiia bacterium]|nr:ABC transporter permease subunit [Acidimicrobiia bacterium]
MTATAARPSPSPSASPAGLARRSPTGLRHAVASEWVKVRSVRSTAWTALAAGALLPVTAVFVAATGSLQPDDTVLGASLTGAALAQVAAAVFGVLAMTGEVASGTIRTTLAACPRRGTVLGAKAIVTAVVLFVPTLVGSALAHLVGSAMLAGQGYAPGDPWPALIGIAACYSVVGVLGLAVGTVVRHSTGGIVAMLALILLPQLFGPLFGDLRPWVGGAAPLAALEKLTQTSDALPEAVGTLGAWPSLAVVTAYSAAALIGSGALLARRDA